MEIIKAFCLGLIVGLLIVITFIIGKIGISIQENTQELKKVNEGFEMINRPLGKAINKEYAKWAKN